MQKLLGVGYARIWANYETGYGGATRCIVYRHLFETRPQDSAIRLLPRISYPFGEIRGNNLFDSHIRHPGTVRTVRGDSYYQRIGFEQVLLVDEKTYEQSRWWR